MTSAPSPVPANAPARRATGAASREKVAAARLSVLAGVTLVAAKLVVGLSIGSVAVLSEAAHSATDLLAALIAFWAVRVADAPPDDDHPYGHGKFESLSGMLEAALIALAGVYIVVESVRALQTGHPAQTPLWGVGVMVLSAVVNSLVAWRMRTVAQKTDSVALRADAQHLMVDVYTSAGVAVGLILVAVTKQTFLDPLSALVVAGFVFHTAVHIAREAAAPLIDSKLPDAEIALVKSILQNDPAILDWHKLRTRKSGSHRHIDVHILMDDALSLRDAHQVAEDLEDRLRAALPNVHVMTHTEPFEEEMRHHAEIPH